MTTKAHAKRGGRYGGEAPPQEEHVVTLYPTAISPSPSPDTDGWTNPTNVYLDDGNVAVVDNLAGLSTSPQHHFTGFGTEDVLPSDAVIDIVEVEVENRHDGTAGAAARPQINPRVNSQPGTWVGRTDMTNVLTPFSNDITGQAATNQVAWGTPTAFWTREMLLDENFLLGVRSRNVGDVAGIHEWDYVRLKITYTGSPPGLPAQVRYTMTVGTTGDGSGEVTGPGIDTGAADGTQEYPAGTNVPLLATPDSLQLFEGWEGAGVPAGHAGDNPLTIIMDAGKAVDASFAGTPPGDPVESHWGTIIAQDLGIGSARSVWQETSTPWYSNGYPAESGDPDADPYLTREAETGAWIPKGQASPTTHFRRFKTPPAPPQAIYDSHVSGKHYPEGDNATTRCQAQRWSSSSAFWIGREGDRVWTVFGFRVMEDPPLSFDLAPGGGNVKFTQLVQWKSRGSGYSEVDAMSVGQNGVKFNIGSHPEDGPEFYDPVPCEHGLWHRVALEMMVSADDEIGYFTPWMRLNGASAWSQVAPKRFLSTIVPGGYRNMGIGPYHHIDETTGNTEYYHDIRDVQIMRYT